MRKNSKLTDREAEALRHLRACGDGSLKAYAETNGLDAQRLYDAKARLKRQGVLPAPAARLVRVERPGGTTRSPTLCRVVLRNGVAVEVACAPGEWGALLAEVAALP